MLTFSVLLCLSITKIDYYYYLLTKEARSDWTVCIKIRIKRVKHIKTIRKQ